MHPAPGFVFGSRVCAVFRGGYPVEGTLEAVIPHPDGDFAVVRVTADAGLYRAGDIITPRAAQLEVAAVS
jgi:hypothetical protein